MAVDNVVAEDDQAPGSARRRVPWTTWLPAAVVALGAAIRVRQWAGARSLWLDEAMVALNVLDLGFRDLAGELRFNQGAPAGWLWAERAMYLAFGPEERPLRVVPLITGVAALVVFWVLARRVVGPSRAPLAVAVAALSPHLVRYSNEVKQYQTDVLAYVTIVLVAVLVAEAAPGTARWRRLVVAWAVVSAGAVWVSHPAVLMLAPAAVLVAVPMLRRRDWWSLALWGSVGSQHAANYYGRVLGLQTNGVFLPGAPDRPCDDLTTLANAGADRTRTWLVVSHCLGMTWAQERDLISRFGLVAGLRARHVDQDAGVWLFDPALPPAASLADFPSGPCLRIVRVR